MITANIELLTKVRDMGAQSLSDAEVLAITLDIPTGEARDKLWEHQSLMGALHSTETPLKQYALAQCSLELSRRYILDKMKKGKMLNDPAIAKDFAAMTLKGEDSEKFMCIFTDNRHRVISSDVMFHGTIDGASVYPREVVRRALHHNAAAVILAHNHPSGIAEPSPADERITQKLKDALHLIDVRVLDHIVVGGDQCVSMAERGLM